MYWKVIRKEVKAMPKYDVWLEVRGISGRTSLKDTVTAKNKEEARRIAKSNFYGENPVVKQVKLAK